MAGYPTMLWLNVSMMYDTYQEKWYLVSALFSLSDSDALCHSVSKKQWIDTGLRTAMSLVWSRRSLAPLTPIFLTPYALSL